MELGHKISCIRNEHGGPIRIDSQAYIEGVHTTFEPIGFPPGPEVVQVSDHHGQLGVYEWWA